MSMPLTEAAHTAEYVLRTPKGAVRPGPQVQGWHGRAPAPNAYMSPSDFSLSPMSNKLLRGGRKQKVVVSARAMGLPKDPGFLPDPKEQQEERAPQMEDKENGFVPVVLGEKRIGKVKTFGVALNSNGSKPTAASSFSKLKQRHVPKKGLSNMPFLANQPRIVGREQVLR
eukprot:TRINITY_DN15431_c0_g1_i1.p1 TRINITY_DN15431_c0_g1~~TRINITY_DN15431_c0_g1_i1.p1  ORF type:complete len:170 (-),score=24.19 TRINITY_DN15431_c0_g1_i1:289-798(-)